MAKTDFIDILRDIRGEQLTKELASQDETCIYGEIVKKHQEVISSSSFVNNNQSILSAVGNDLILGSNSKISVVAADLLAQDSDLNIVATNLSLNENSSINILSGIKEDILSLNEAKDGIISINDRINNFDSLFLNMPIVLDASDNAIASRVSADKSKESADDAEEAYKMFKELYIGPRISDPIPYNDGDFITTGTMYYNTMSHVLKIFGNNTWHSVPMSIEVSLTIENNLSDLSDISEARDNLNVYSAQETDSKFMILSEYDSNSNGKVDSAQNSDTVNNLTVETSVPSNAIFTQNDFTNAYKDKVDTIETNAKDDQNASEVPFVASSGIASTDVQAAIEEVKTDSVSLTGTNAQTIASDVTFNGNTYFNGSETQVNHQTVTTQDNLIVINSGEVGAGVTSGSAGIEVDRGTLENFHFKFVESDDSFKVGKISALQSVATREDTPTDGGVATWNATDKKFNTSKNVTVDDITIDGRVIDHLKVVNPTAENVMLATFTGLNLARGLEIGIGADGPVNDAYAIYNSRLAGYGGHKWLVAGAQVGSLDKSGNLTTSGNVNGRDVASDGIKLDAIGTEADFLAALNYK